MKICILSDSHDHMVLLDAAAAEAKERGAEAILHCGDVVAPSTMKCLNKYGIPVHVIHGNNTGDLYTMGMMAAKPGNVIEYHGMDAKLSLGGKRVFMVHYPHYARAMATTGDWDLVCCGHSHNYREEKVPNIKDGETLILNPGTIGGVGKAPATFIMIDLETMEVEKLEISKSIEKDAPPSEEDYNQPAY
jgi:putative phosphoesterase